MNMNFKLTEQQHAKMAADLHAALVSGTGTQPPSETIAFTMDDAYMVRSKLVDLLVAEGGVPKGHKIGFTSETMQKMYGMTGPDFGQLLSNMFVADGEPVNVRGLSDTRVEPEIAFEMANPLSGPGLTIEDVLAATHKVYASIEVIDSRVGAMRAKAVDSIADNAGAGRVVLASRGLDPKEIDFNEIIVSITVDGETQTAPACDVMGHPAAPVAWLAGRLFELNGLGGEIKSGDIIMSGSSTRSVAVGPGSKLEAEFGVLGRLQVHFT